MLGEIGAGGATWRTCATKLGLDEPLLAQYRDLSRRARARRSGHVVPVQHAGRAARSASASAGPRNWRWRPWLVAIADRAAARRRSARSFAATGSIRWRRRVSLLGISMPNFWLGPLLAIVFAVTLGWLPVSGTGTWQHLVLPAVTLGAALAAMLARMTRATLIDELRELYVLAARARGAVARARRDRRTRCATA